MSEFSFQCIPAPLLLWYRANKRDLPWRHDPSAYEVWVSEIMLQQTRVEAVKEYYTRFMQALPTLEDLAACEEERLLKLWEGLGYYNRVRNMQKAARALIAYYDGVFPKDKAALMSLPGIGSYTAGAICSIAYGQPTAAVDGNVFRVAARLEENPMPISKPVYRAYLEKTLASVYPQDERDCSDFTQSIFELGALICKPQNPECGVCPLKNVCRAYRNGSVSYYPVMPEKKPKREEEVYVFLIETPQGFCIRRRTEGVLKGMNEFPSQVFFDGESAGTILNEWGMYEFKEVTCRNFTHIFTHIRWNMTCVWVRTESAPFDTYSIEEIETTISLPTAFRQCLQVLKHEKRKEDL